MAEEREPLSFWGTVGAVMVSGVITGGVTFLLSLLFVKTVATQAAMEATKQPQQPNNGS